MTASIPSADSELDGGVATTLSVEMHQEAPNHMDDEVVSLSLLIS